MAPAQRLLAIAAAVGAERREAARQLVEKLEQEPDGSLTAAAVARLEAQEAELVRARNYRDAAAVADVLHALGPKPTPLTLQDCAPAVTDQLDFFLENGFCVFPGVLEGEALARTQEAWLRAEAPERARWDAARAEKLRLHGDAARPPDADSPIAHYAGFEASGRLLANGTAPYDNGKSYPMSTFDLPALAGQDPIFLDILDSPKILPLLSQVCGAGGYERADESSADSPYHGVVHCGGCSGRVVPSESNEEGYLTWHRDKPAADGWPLPNYRLIKIFTAIFDIPLNGGATALVPATHRFATDPRQTFLATYGGGATVGELPHSAMPNMIECAVPAGTSVACGSLLLPSFLPSVPPSFSHCHCHCPRKKLADTARHIHARCSRFKHLAHKRTEYVRAAAALHIRRLQDQREQRRGERRRQRPVARGRADGGARWPDQSPVPGAGSAGQAAYDTAEVARAAFGGAVLN